MYEILNNNSFFQKKSSFYKTVSICYRDETTKDIASIGRRRRTLGQFTAKQPTERPAGGFSPT